MSINNYAEKNSELKKQTFFVDGWLRYPAFQGWLSKDKDNARARCTYCHKTIELSFIGRSALTDPSTEESTESSGETIVSNKKSQKTLEMHFHTADWIKAETIWTLKSVLGGFSVRANDELNETLSAMFPDSDSKLQEILVWQEPNPCMTSTTA